MLHLENELVIPSKPRSRRASPGSRADGRLIAVSNRVSRPAAGAAPGGLARAVSEALRGEGGVWVGWSGRTVAASGGPPVMDVETANGIDYALLDLETDNFRGFYEGYANGVLWPVFHGRPDLSVHHAADFAEYRAVNRTFASAVAGIAGDRDTIWVHDYHFLPLADELRRAGVASTIGLFLHIPFPHLHLLRAVPEAVELARALTAYDSIGVQTRRDATNLAQSLAGLCGGSIRESAEGCSVQAGGRNVRIQALPIGVDVGGLRAQLDRPAPDEVARYLATLQNRAALIGIDRLDYSKGIPQRLEAYFEYLKADPAARSENTVFTQIAPLSRSTVEAYATTRREVEAVAGRISGQFSTLYGSPLRLLTRAFDRRSVAHLMAHAQAALVTPLADGMNLVAKEFVAVQDPQDPGVLVLSEFAGAAEAMRDAVLVNPHDAEGMCASIEMALAMPLGERRARHAALMDVVRDTDISRWTARCLASLADVRRPSAMAQHAALPAATWHGA